MTHGRKTGGRQAGTPNKATIDARFAIANFVEGNVERLNGWLEEIAQKDPKQAFDCFMSVIEYNIPKLARTEHTGDGGGDIKHDIAVRFVEWVFLLHGY